MKLQRCSSEPPTSLGWLLDDRRAYRPRSGTDDASAGVLAEGTASARLTILVSGTAFGQVLVLAASPLLTRIYTPADFGVLAVLTGFLGVFGAVGSFRYELAIPLADDEQPSSSPWSSAC